MVIVEDSYVSIKYEKNFRWLNSGGVDGYDDKDNGGGGGGENHGHDGAGQHGPDPHKSSAALENLPPMISRTLK